MLKMIPASRIDVILSRPGIFLQNHYGKFWKHFLKITLNFFISLAGAKNFMNYPFRNIFIPRPFVKFLKKIDLSVENKTNNSFEPIQIGSDM